MTKPSYPKFLYFAMPILVSLVAISYSPAKSEAIQSSKTFRPKTAYFMAAANSALVWSRSLETDVISCANIGSSSCLASALLTQTFSQDVWDNGKYHANPSVPPGVEFASWNQINFIDLRHFQATFTFPGELDPNNVVGLLYDPYYTSNIVPINDNLYVYLNGVQSYVGGYHYGAGSMGPSVIPETDGWYVPSIKLSTGFSKGVNTIDIITEDYALWGGMGYLVLRLQQLVFLPIILR